MYEIFSFLISGAVLGITAGISPGPLLTLVISETLRYNTRAGIKVAIAPLITDGPIILISIFILAKISNLDSILGLISLLGAIFLGYLAYESLTIKRVSLNFDKKEQSLKKGIITNALSPHPYLFYFSVGGPIMLKALNSNFFALLLFISSFLILLVSSKIILAVIVSKSKTFLQSRFYIYTIKFLGVILLVFSLIFLKYAFEFFSLL